MLQSKSSVIRDCLIVDLSIDDFEVNNYEYYISKLLQSSQKTKVILNLQGIDVITSADIQNIEKTVTLFTLSGAQSIVCGINPYSAALIFSFVDEIKFESQLGVEEALDAFANR